MEYILIELFGGGILDWEDIANTQYDWGDIIETAKYNNGEDNIELLNINDFYYAILELALEELQREISDYIKNNYSEKEKDVFEQLREIDCNINNVEQWDIFCNCLDTHITFVGNRELAENLSSCLQQTIDRISDKIGFTYINLDI